MNEVTTEPVSVETGDAVETIVAEEATEAVEAPATDKVVEAAVEAPVDTEVAVEEASTATEGVPAEVAVETPAVDDAEEVAPIYTAEQIDRANKEVRKLRQENKDRRKALEALQELQVPGEVSPFQEGWSAIGELLDTDPDAGIAVLEEMLTQAKTEPAKPLTPADIEAQVISVFQKQQDMLAVEAAKQQVRLEVETLGYNPDATADENAVEYARHQLLWDFLNAQPAGQKDITAAHSQVNAFAQKLLDDKLVELAAANTGLPTAMGGAASPVGATEETEVATTPASRAKSAEEKTIEFYKNRKNGSGTVLS